MTYESSLQRARRNRKLRKPPHTVGTKSQDAKASPRRGHEIATCESFPTPWARNRKMRKLPHSVGTESQAAKASPHRGHEIASRESFPTAWARNRSNQP